MHWLRSHHQYPGTDQMCHCFTLSTRCFDALITQPPPVGWSLQSIHRCRNVGSEMSQCWNDERRNGGAKMVAQRQRHRNVTYWKKLAIISAVCHEGLSCLNPFSISWHTAATCSSVERFFLKPAWHGWSIIYVPTVKQKDIQMFYFFFA